MCIQYFISNFPSAELQSQLDTTKGSDKGGGERDKYKNLARRLKEERNNYKELAEEKRKEQEELKVITPSPGCLPPVCPASLSGVARGQQPRGSPYP